MQTVNLALLMPRNFYKTSCKFSLPALTREAISLILKRMIKVYRSLQENA